MPNAIEVVKKAAVEAVEATKPMNVLFGTVISTSPLKIQAGQKSIYTSKMLVLSRNVTDHDVFLTKDQVKERYRIHQALAVGEKVILLRIQGGKKFLVLDRVSG